MLYPRYLFRKVISLKYLNKHFSKIDNFLDIGGGAGDFSFTLLQKIKNGTVIDFSEEAVEVLKKKNSENKLNIILGNFLQHQFHEQFSLITMFEVLEHINDHEKALQEIHQLLKQQGFLLLSVPAKMSKWNRWDEMAGHYRRYEKNELIELLNKNRFEVKKLSAYGFPILNIIVFIRDRLFKGLKKDNETNTENMSKKSGLGYIQYFRLKSLIIPILTLFFNEKMIALYSQFTSLFDKYDLGDGYLVLAKKIDK